MYSHKAAAWQDLLANGFRRRYQGRHVSIDTRPALKYAKN